MNIDSSFHFRRGVSCYHVADFESAVNEFSKVLNFDPDSVDAYLYRALATDECGDPDDLRTDLETILRLDPESGQGHFARAWMLFNENIRKAEQDPKTLYEETIQLYSNAILLSPDLAPAYFYRGEMRCGVGDGQGALEDYDKAIELERSYAQAYWRRGQVRAERGDFRQAIDDLEFYLTLPMGATWNSQVMKNISAYWLQLALQSEAKDKSQLPPREI